MLSFACTLIEGANSARGLARPLPVPDRDEPDPANEFSARPRHTPHPAGRTATSPTADDASPNGHAAAPDLQAQPRPPRPTPPAAPQTPTTTLHRRDARDRAGPIQGQSRWPVRRAPGQGPHDPKQTYPHRHARTPTGTNQQAHQDHAPATLSAKLDQLAHRAGEPPAKVAAQLIRQAIDNHDAALPALHDQARSGRQPDDDEDRRAPWLEPYGGSREWRGLTWGAVVGLHARYPDALSSLKDGWWRDAGHLETLSALAAWRQAIDDAGRDPREELSFQIQLTNYGRLLREDAGSILDRWEPGAPPADW